MTNTAAEQGTTLFCDQTTREVGSPDGDTYLHTIKQFTRAELREHFEEANQHLFEELVRQDIQGLTDRRVTVTIDITNWEYYGERGDAEMCWARNRATITSGRIGSRR